jgi:hypothetical protein
MNINFIPFFVLLGVMATAVLALFVYRKSVSRNEDDSLHVLHGQASAQTALANKLDAIDKWGKTLTIITVVYGIALAAAYVYQGWVQSSSTGL